MANQLTIGIDARMWGPAQTGIGRYVSSLCASMFARIPDDVRFVLFMLDPSAGSVYKNRSDIAIIPVKERWYSVSEQLTLPLRLAAARPDVLFVPHFNVPLLWRGKFVATMHDVTPLFYPGPLQKRMRVRRAAFQAVFRSTVSRASALIAVSSYTRDAVTAHFRAEPGKISVIPEGIAPLFFQKVAETQRAAFKTRYHIKKPYLFYTGVWRPHKNLCGLLEAFMIVKARLGSRYTLVLGGEEDPRYPEVRRTWERLGLESDLILPGFIPEEELLLWYKGASAVVIPSFMEGFGLVGLEALAAGVPVAASRAGAMPEVLEGAARYFDPHKVEDMAETIAAVLDDPRERSRQQREAAMLLPNYSWDKAAEETLSILRRVARGS